MGMRQPLIILGTHAFAEEVADLIGDCDEYELTGFAENWDRDRCSSTLLGLPIVWIEDLPSLVDTHMAVCAIGSPLRSRFVESVKAMGFRFVAVKHPGARISGTSSMGTGSLLSAGVVVASHTTIGDHVIINRGSLIGHHTTIADYVTISPGANIAGRVSIGAGSYIGIGATILNDIKIGGQAVVGAGSVVTRDVPDQVQVLGVPARITRE